MIGQFFIQIVAEEPADAQPIGSDTDQLSLRAESLEEHHELELEEDRRIDGWPAALLLGSADQVADEAQVELGLKVTRDVAGGDQVLKGAIAERGETPAPSYPSSEPPTMEVWLQTLWQLSTVFQRAGALHDFMAMRAHYHDQHMSRL